MCRAQIRLKVTPEKSLKLPRKMMLFCIMVWANFQHQFLLQQQIKWLFPYTSSWWSIGWTSSIHLWEHKNLTSCSCQEKQDLNQGSSRVHRQYFSSSGMSAKCRQDLLALSWPTEQNPWALSVPMMTPECCRASHLCINIITPIPHTTASQNQILARPLGQISIVWMAWLSTYTTFAIQRWLCPLIPFCL